MSSVLEFVPRPRDASVQTALAGGAEIVIFPGVRFERIDFDADIFEPDGPTTPDAGQPVNRKRAVKS
jgi:hypothetical protein